jgi:hypothetical protein
MLSDAERARLGEIAHRLSRKGSRRARNGRPILAWYGKPVARKFSGS